MTAADDDEALDELIHRADLDGLVRLVDDCDGGAGLATAAAAARRARHAVGTGRQLWPAATLAEYRLALLAPAAWAAGVLDEGSGRFTIGPLTEVVGPAPHVGRAGAPARRRTASRRSSPTSGRCAARRSSRPRSPSSPTCSTCRTRSAAWEPDYSLADYRAVDAEFPSPPPPGGLRRGPACPPRSTIASSRRRRRARRPPARRAMDGQLERPGRVVAVDGSAGGAARPRADAAPGTHEPDAGRGRGLAGVGRRQRRRPRPAAGRGGRPVRRPVAGRRARPTCSTTGRSPLDELGGPSGRAAVVVVGRPRAGHRLAAAAGRRGPAEGLAWAISARGRMTGPVAACSSARCICSPDARRIPGTDGPARRS